MKAPQTKSPYAPTFYKDGSVKLWDPYKQGWVRTIKPSDQILATMSNELREKVEAHTAKASVD